MNRDARSIIHICIYQTARKKDQATDKTRWLLNRIFIPDNLNLSKKNIHILRSESMRPMIGVSTGKLLLLVYPCRNK